MGAVFANTPVQPTVAAVQVGRSYFDAPCKYCRDGTRATTNVRPVDYIGRPMADLNVCGPHAKHLVERARRNKAAAGNQRATELLLLKMELLQRDWREPGRSGELDPEALERARELIRGSLN